MAGPTIQYQRQVDEDDELQELTRTEIIFQQMRLRGNRWPRAVGVVEIAIGVLVSVLGALEVFILPLVEAKEGDPVVVFNKQNCYGVGMLAGLVMLLTGSTGIRASLSQRNTTVFRFYNLTIVSLLVYMGLTIFLIVAYGVGWTSPDKYAPDSSLREVHIFVTISTVMGLLFALTSFVQYFDIICCGDSPLWIQWARCFCPCVYSQRRRRLSFDRAFREELDDRSNPI